MKHLKSLLLAATLFVATSFTAQAQTKVAHINTQELVEAMPEMQSAKAELEKLAKTYETDIQAMATELQNKVKQYDGESSTKTVEENGKRLQEVQGMEQGIRQYQTQAQQDLQKKEFDLLKSSKFETQYLFLSKDLFVFSNSPLLSLYPQSLQNDILS